MSENELINKKITPTLVTQYLMAFILRNLIVTRQVYGIECSKRCVSRIDWLLFMYVMKLASGS